MEGLKQQSIKNAAEQREAFHYFMILLSLG
jgi:hypothetical protein